MYPVRLNARLSSKQGEKLAALAHKWGLLNAKGDPDWSAVMRKLIEDAGD